MEELTYFEALTYIQSGIILFRNGKEVTEKKVNDLFFNFLNDENKTIDFEIKML